MGDEARLREYLEKVTVDLRKARRHAQDLERQAREPIAIVGMACRYPGGVRSPRDLWEVLRDEIDAIAPFPRDRGWDLESLYDPDPDRPRTTYVREAGFVDGVADFDPAFFGISPREALAMDPQQRLLLEASWEALEDAGVDPEGLRGSEAGVFAGAGAGDYGIGVLRDEELEAYGGIGAMSSVLSGRIAYTLGLEGPALTVDTACSSSLVAMHLAAGALRGGECSLALAGGVTAMATPSGFVSFSRQRVLAPDGRCKAFAEAADGTGWAEGVGMLVLERLSDAKRNGHRVHAMIVGSAVNQDGASNGLAAPNGPAQQRVIRQALANAGLSPAEVDAVEAHGTGTALGDPIEAGALLATYGQERERPLWLGSIKSNIGHTSSAAGVAGVIKVALAMREGVLPKTLHVDQPSAKVDWEAGRVRLLSEPEPWPPNGRPRRAGVSSFGISGTNAHLILEEPPEPEEEDSNSKAPVGPFLLALSARSEPALREAAARLATHLTESETPLADASFTLARARAALPRRAVALAADREAAIEALKAIRRGAPHPRVAEGRQRGGKLAFLFTGQGAQRAGMGRELYEAEPAYREAFDSLCSHLDPLLGQSLALLCFSEPGSEQAKALEDTTYAQAAIFATEVALHRLLEAKGLKADLLAGHSVGEISAAHVAGVLSEQGACELVAARGKLMGALPPGGAMIAIEASEEEVAKALSGREGELSIAAVNGAAATVISGEQEAALEVAAAFEERGAKSKRLEVSHAFHSPLIEPMLAGFASALAKVEHSPPRVPLISALEGEPLDAKRATDPSRWLAHARGPVRFAAALATLAQQGASALLEVGPDPVLLGIAAALPETGEMPRIPTLREERPEQESLYLALAGAHAAGARLDWERHFAPARARLAELPTYPFQHKRYWIDSAAAPDLAAAGLKDAGHPFLGAAIETPEGGLLMSGRISLATHPWLADRRIGEAVLLPGVAFLELAFAAAEQAGAQRVGELTLQAPLALAEGEAHQLRLSLSPPDQGGARSLAIHSRPEAEGEQAPWLAHASGELSQQAAPEPEPLAEWPPEGARPLEAEDLYERLAGAGLAYGAAFQGLSAAWQLGEDTYAEVSLAPERAAEAERFALHPALLEGALASFLAMRGDGEPLGPSAFSAASLSLPGASALRLRISPRDDGGAAVAAFEGSGEPVLSIGTVEAARLDLGELGRPGNRSLYQVRWPERELEADLTGRVALLGEAEQLHPGAERFGDLAALLEAIEDGLEPPDVVVAVAPEASAEQLPGSARSALTAALADLVQPWAAAPLAASRLVLLTRGAQAVAEGESADPAGAALWGLFRSARSENPGRFALLDRDSAEASSDALLAAVLATGEDSELALRGGRCHVPRLGRLERERGAGEAEPIAAGSTVLLSGGTGGIGRQVARHLVSAHDVRSLLLVSRSGPSAEGAAELEAELRAAGAEVTIAACDVADRAQLEELLAAIPSDRPLAAVVHTAAVLADGVVESLGPEQIEAAFAAKAEGAWNLHEATREMDLSLFVLFSSIAATLGNPAQACYAAANAFLDGLAALRRAAGLPATSLAWGPWAESGMLEQLGAADRARLERFGFAAMSSERGLECLDLALAAGAVTLAPVEPNRRALRAQAGAGMLPEVLGQLVGGPPRRRRNQAPVLERIAGAPAADRGQIVLDLVREHAASVLGYTAGSDIEPTMAFKDLGFDSLGAVELRNRLAAATGLSLPPALVFDHPSAAVLAEHLLAELEGAEPAVANVVSTRSAHDEPVAIVGMACRYPGGATSPEGLWRLVDEGVDAIGGFPADRGWDVESIYDPDPERAGTSYVREGGFVAGATEFDPAFFGIGPREARSMDPQQRLLLETCWEALEDAGVDPLSLRGTPTGIFAGASPTDYGLASALEGSDEYAMTGTSASVLSGRVAYTLGLEGPALTLDTACSSSLVALHLACQALRGGECSLALAAGVSIFASPVLFVASSRMRALALDGRSKSFAEGADGTGVSEGVGVLLVERLSDARRNGHPVLGVVRGSAVNQDGASNGLTAPNGPAQQRVIRQALADAGLAPQEVDAVEAHGTGTALGDPIEAGALLATYGRDRDEPLRLGAIKSNIGHPQAAAGMAGVIKMTMAMREGTLPKTLHAERPSSLIDWSAGAVELLSESRPWPAGGSPRRAAVSSFGVSGTNAHVILEEPPPAEEPAVSGSGGGEEVLRPDVVPLLVSAKSEAPLREQAARLAARLDADPECSLLDLAHSLAAGRAQLEQRAVVLAADREQALERLRMLAEGKAGAGIVRGRAKPAGKVAFLFAGYGSQWPGMALDLIESAPVFARHMRECAAALDPHLDWSIEDVLRGANGAPPLDRVDVGPPALFAVMSSLARLWMACGVKPSVVVGHSQGELTAAYLAGGLSLEDAARAMALRSKLLMKLVGKGAMAAVGLGTAELAPRLERWDGKIEIAVLNGPASTVLAGQPETLDDLLAELQAEGLRAKYVPGVVAPGHSSYVEPVREELLEVFAPISPRSGDVPFHSTVAAGLVDTAELDAEYWYRNLRGTVQLEPVVRDLLSGGARALIEMSPHPALAVSLQETVDAALSDPGSATVLGSLRRGEGGLERFASSLAEAHVAGLEVDWGVFFAGARRVKLPTYPFQRKRYWLEDGAAPRGRRPVEGPADSAEAATDPQPSTLRERLAVAPSREREEMALAQVREQVAAQLGYDSAAEIDPERPLLELGLDSVGAMAVRKRLIETTGAELPVAALVDRPTVVSVARRLSAVIGGEGGEEAEGGAPTTLLTLLRGAQGHEQRTAVMDLIAEASRFRPFFDSDGAASRAPAPVRLAEGEEQPALLLLPSVAAMSGAREYARFAAPFRGRRMVEVYPAPGFERGEALPASVEACAEAQAAAILGGEPPSELVLAGHSSGGWLAHATAARLEGMGVYPKAVILLDTYLQDERVFAWLEPSLMDALREAGDSMALVDDVRLTAMTAYFRVFSEWRPAAIQAPTVMVRAAEPMPAMDRADPEGWRASWPLPHEAVEARGNHFSMMTEEAESTAATVLKALEALRVPSTPPTMR